MVLPPVATGGHAYLGASPACWARFGGILAGDYTDAARMRVHRLTVDAYAAQHAGRPERRTIRSINVHLLGLHLAIDPRLPAGMILDRLRRLKRRPDLVLDWYEPPRLCGSHTVADVATAPSAEDHHRRVRLWAQDIWSAWRTHHPAIAALADMVG